MSEVDKPYPLRMLRPLLLCMATAGAVAVLSTALATRASFQSSVAQSVTFLLRFVPSVATISNATANRQASEIILLSQWVFAPVYLFIWFYTARPWSSRMRTAVLLKNRGLTDAQRAIGLPLAYLFLGAWILGDFGVIEFPTLFNGKYVYPPAQSVPQLQAIYSSPMALACYAWISPIVETTFIWVVSLFLFNLKAYFSPSA